MSDSTSKPEKPAEKPVEEPKLEKVIPKTIFNGFFIEKALFFLFFL